MESGTKTDGFSCHKCRAEREENGLPGAPCDSNDGICTIGHIELLPANMEAMKLHNDIADFTWEMVKDFNEFKWTQSQMSGIMNKLRIIRNTIAECQADGFNG